MKFEAKLVNLVGIKAKFLRWGIYFLRDVESPTHFQQNGVEGWRHACAAAPLKSLNKVSVLLLGDLELVFISGVFTVLDFHKVDLSLV